MLAEEVLLDAVDAEADVGPPVDGVDVEIKQLLVLRGELIVDINGLDAFAKPFLR